MPDAYAGLKKKLSSGETSGGTGWMKLNAQHPDVSDQQPRTKQSDFRNRLQKAMLSKLGAASLAQAQKQPSADFKLDSVKERPSSAEIEKEENQVNIELRRRVTVSSNMSILESRKSSIASPVKITNERSNSQTGITRLQFSNQRSQVASLSPTSKKQQSLTRLEIALK